jgi:hypothetical protein
MENRTCFHARRGDGKKTHLPLEVSGLNEWFEVRSFGYSAATSFQKEGIGILPAYLLGL